MDEDNLLGEFELHRPRLTGLARRMLGSQSDADDAVQETWLRAARAPHTEVDNPAGWFTTITARVCLNLIRARSTRREDPFDDVRSDPVVAGEHGPEYEITLAESVSVAIGVVVDLLEPAERVAFVLHDMFAVPFDDIAAIIERSPAATRQLASRARRRVAGREAGQRIRRIQEHRRVVDAFFVAVRSGRLDQLLAVLDPDVALRSWGGPSTAAATAVVHGASTIAGRALAFAQPDAELRPVAAAGRPGVLATVRDRRTALMIFGVTDGLITTIDALTDPVRLAHLDLCHD